MPLDSTGSDLTVSDEQVSDKTAMQLHQGIAPKRGGGAGYVEEAPIDGEIYARKDAAWLRLEITPDPLASDIKLDPIILGCDNLQDLLEELASRTRAANAPTAGPNPAVPPRRRT